MPNPLILLAEDREHDIVLIQRALKQAAVKCPVRVVRDGEEVIAYLKGAKYQHLSRRSMIDKFVTKRVAIISFSK